jgi:hypothetical protein
MKNSYVVIVNNVGQVYNGSVKTEAMRIAQYYKGLSRQEYGSSASEEVVVLCDDTVVWEYVPQQDGVVYD